MPPLPLLSGCSLALAAAAAFAQAPTRYAGPCDSSAAAALDALHFVVADDEQNRLHVYRRGQAQSVAVIDLAKFLGGSDRGESDIEGAAQVGSRIYWITSHSRDSKGRRQDDRHRFFATEIVPGTPPTVLAVGRPYEGLLDDLEDAPMLKPYKLAKAARLAAEAEGGFNIEGLAATPDGRLLIGLRNPLVQGRALLIPLDNPGELVEPGKAGSSGKKDKKGAHASLGKPILLDLGGRGIRSIDLVDGSYFIVAGPTADQGSFAVFRWSGQAAQAPTPLPGATLGDMRPEALFAVPGGRVLQLLSDDGGLRTAGVECKDLPAARQSFRSLDLQR